MDLTNGVGASMGMFVPALAVGAAGEHSRSSSPCKSPLCQCCYLWGHLLPCLCQRWLSALQVSTFHNFKLRLKSSLCLLCSSCLEAYADIPDQSVGTYAGIQHVCAGPGCQCC